MRFLRVVAASVLLTLALVVPVAASGGGGCSAFGAVTASDAHAGGFGRFVASYATTGAGVISGIVAGEHAGYCVHP